MTGLGFHAYRRTDVITADPKKLVIMCYEATIHSLKVAKEKYYAREYEAKGKAIQNALDIIGELRAALSFEEGGEIARNLEALYGFWAQHIIKADQSGNLKALEQVAEMLEVIKSAMEEAYHSLQEGQTLPLPFGNSSLSPTKEVNSG